MARCGEAAVDVWSCGGDHPYLNILTRGDPRRPSGDILTAEERDAQRDLYNNYPIAPAARSATTHAAADRHECTTEAVCAAFFNARLVHDDVPWSCDNDSPYGRHNNVPLLALG